MANDMCHKCGKAKASRKVEEVILRGDPMPHRHPLTAQLCHQCFVEVMGPAATRWPFPTLVQSPAERSE